MISAGTSWVLGTVFSGRPPVSVSRIGTGSALGSVRPTSHDACDWFGLFPDGSDGCIAVLILSSPVIRIGGSRLRTINKFSVS